MEDIFQIAIIVIFIVSSIISSLKKKKKNEQKPTGTTHVPSGNASAIPASKSQSSSKSVLEEILGFKIDIPEPPQKEAPNSSYENSASYDNIDSYDNTDSYDTSWNPEESYGVKESEGRSDYVSINLAKKEQLSSAKEKYHSFKKEEDISISKKLKPNRIKRIIADKNNLRDYFVIQDLLNKPKALRK